MLGRSSARPKLVDPTGFDTPARAELALAIAARAAADETINKLESARVQLFDAVSVARTNVDGAEEAVERAKADASSYMLATVIGTAGAAPVTVKASRQTLLEAEDGLNAALAARDGLDGHIADAARAREKASERVNAAVVAVMRESPAVAGMLADVSKLAEGLIAKGRALSWLVSHGVIPGGATAHNTPPGDEHYVVRRVKLFVDALPVMMLPHASNVHVPIADHPGALPWVAAMAALQNDANAPLPE